MLVIVGVPNHDGPVTIKWDAHGSLQSAIPNTDARGQPDRSGLGKIAKIAAITAKLL